MNDTALLEPHVDSGRRCTDDHRDGNGSPVDCCFWCAACERYIGPTEAQEPCSRRPPAFIHRQDGERICVYVSCPTCSATAGTPCEPPTRQMGVLTYRVHVERFQAWERATSQAMRGL